MRLVWLVVGVAVALGLSAPPSARAGTLAFVWTTCDEVVGCSSLWLAEDDGSGLREVPLDNVAAPAWSPDGTRIAYQYGRTLRSARTDGSDDRSILDAGASYAGPPDWSPIDDLLAFPFTDHSGPGYGGGGAPLGSLYESDIYLIRSDGSGLRRLAGGAGNEDSVRFSPDGKRVEFYRNENPLEPGRPAGLYSIAIDGTEERLMAFGDGVYQPTPSPDGRYLAFMKNGVLWTIDERGGEARAWTPPGSTAYGPLRWSPVGPKLYFVLRAEPGLPAYKDMAIHVADLSRPDAGARRLLSETGSVLYMDWTGPGVPAPTDDDAPPAVTVLTGGSGPAAAAAVRRPLRVLSKRRSRILAFDMTGIRTIRLAVAKQERRRGERRCRFLGARRFGPPRACSKPIFRSVRSSAAFNERLGKLRPGRYLMAFATKDVVGNHVRRPKLSRVTVRP